jgi:cAMP-dependent protein kinase regulator
MTSNETVLKEKIRPIMEQLVYQLVLERPDCPVNYMIDYLQKLGGYTSNGITIDEKKELERLRCDIKKYRDIEEENKDDKMEHEFTDEEDDIDDTIEKKVISAQSRLSRQREAVSSEVYGQFNKKEDFVPKYVAKNDDQLQRIKARVLQSFLFAALDSKDLNIVIGTMEEKHYKSGDSVITQGESGDCLYIVESGELNCYKTFVSILIKI